MKILTEEMLPTIKEIVYFKDGEGIYALLNTYTNLYSYMKDLSVDNQDCFKDLSNDTKDDENVHIYFVEEALKPAVDKFLQEHYEKTNRYAYLEELDSQEV